MLHPERIAHVVLKVRNLEQSKKFYTETLGMRVMKDVPQLRAVFLSFNGRDHHEIALFEIGAKAEAPKPNQTGMLHIAFRLRTEDDLIAAYKELKEKGTPVSFTVNHGVSKSIYFRDPDDNELEVYLDNDITEMDELPNAYLGMEKLEFAKDDKGLADIIASMRH
ncbi:MAG: VOC family protein [Candidatus Binatia bacterium]